MHKPEGSRKPADSTRDDKDPVPLSAMSERQRRLVESHLPLVHLTLRRCDDLIGPRRPEREAGELLQEGCLALVEAVRTHDPARHGRFASFAMARIHYAMSRYAHEQYSLIRIPFITQRRRKKPRIESEGDRRPPAPLPRVVRMSERGLSPSRNLNRRLYGESMAGLRDGLTIGDLVRECYDRAVTRVVSRMKSSPRCTPGLRKVLDHCAAERWTVPEPDARTPIRRLAGILGCSISRITHCEERFRRQVAAALEADAAYATLRRLGRRQIEGWRHRLTPESLASLRRLQNARAESGGPASDAGRQRRPEAENRPE